ncbi:hypothetical protein HMSSN036_94010 [Paenibacillus macerans]|nr:hypothetical protein HMSSN036_94010 [Paenibacillus macerans]
MGRNACPAVQYERQLDRVADFFHLFEAEVWFAMVRTMHGAKCRSQRVDSSFIYDADAFVEVGILNPAGNIVFLTADGTDFRFYGTPLA